MDMSAKKRKRLSVNQQAKKRARSTRYKNDANALDADLYTYLATVVKDLEHLHDPEQRASLVSSAMAETSGKEVAVSSDNLGSRLLERILPECDKEQLNDFRENLTQSDHLRAVVNHGLASRVVEKLLAMHTRPKIENLEWVRRMLWFMVNNVAEFSFSASASHVLRTCLSAAAINTNDVSDKERNKDDKNDEKDENEEKRKEHLMPVLELAAEKIVDDSEGSKAMIEDSHAVATVVTLLECLSKSGLVKSHENLMEHLKSLIEQDVFENNLKCRLLEAMVKSCDSKTRQEMYEKFFKGKMIELANHEKANFAVQQLIKACNDKEKFEQWYSDELDEGVDALLKGEVGALNVLVATASTCQRLDTKQNHFFAALQKALTKEGSASDLCESLLQLRCKKQDDVSLQGSLLIQTLLNFKKPIKVVRSLLDLDEKRLVHILSTPRGSHIADAFVSSANVGEKSRDALAKKMQNEVSQLVCSRNGSRAFDALWNRSSERAKEALASGLNQNANSIRSNRFGQYVYQRLNISVFARNREEWKRNVVKADKKDKELEKFAQEFSA